MRLLFFLLVLVISVGCSTAEEEPGIRVRIPAEFEPQEAIWLGFKTLEVAHQIDSVTPKIIEYIHPHVKVNLILEADSLAPNLKTELFKAGMDTSQINVIIQPNTDVWYRDPGPIFAITPHQKLTIVDFKYTNYSNVHPDSIGERARLFEALDRDIAKRLNIDTLNSVVAMEGGAFETDGRGTVIQVEDITLKRNPHLTKAQIEADYKRSCGIINVIWLPHGVADDPHNFQRLEGQYFGFGTGGHTDEFVRFANDSTILLSWVEESERDENPVNKMNYEILSENYEILSAAKDAQGNPYTIIKVPHAEMQVDLQEVNEDWPEKSRRKYQLELGDTIYRTMAVSYLNYLITNDVLIIPQYGDEHDRSTQKDQEVREIFEELYPDRTIYGLNPISLNYNGGGMHCRYQTQPKLAVQE